MTTVRTISEQYFTNTCGILMLALVMSLGLFSIVETVGFNRVLEALSISKKIPRNYLHDLRRVLDEVAYDITISRGEGV